MRRRVLKYVTEQMEEPNAARSKKDKPQAQDFLILARRVTEDAKARTQVRN